LPEVLSIFLAVSDSLKRRDMVGGNPDARWEMIALADIVVGVDTSPGSGEALRWAIDDARLRGTNVRAVLAWAAAGRPEAVDATAGSPLLEDLAVAAGQVLHAAVGEVVDRPAAVKVVERIVYGSPAHALIQESFDAQLLVVGARWQSQPRRVAVGSVGDVCAHEAAVPVVVVRGKGHGRAAPRPRPIVVGVDGSTPSLAALSWAVGEAGLRHVPLRVLHVRLPEEVLVHGSAGPALRRRRVADDILEHCLAECRAVSGEVRIEPELVEGPAAASLLDAAGQAQLLVVGARGRGGFAGLTLGSTSHQCVVRAPCPVAVVRPASALTQCRFPADRTADRGRPKGEQRNGAARTG
jgi:nucleotide-binding universal stress UspA family protein